jgi:putative transposase
VAHVLSRGNNRAKVFHSPSDYDRFVHLLDKATKRHDVDHYAFCIMPNHFHLVVRVDETEQLSQMMQWWLTTHVKRHHPRHASSGHVWQGRFKSFPIQEDEHLLTVLRYVLLNPCRAGLAQYPWEWQWSSLRHGLMIKPWPLEPPGRVSDWLRSPASQEQEDRLRRSITRGAPFGHEDWEAETAARWDLESTLRPRGRPRKPVQVAEPASEFQL